MREAYSFVSRLATYPNAVVVRSLTKFYAIPGLRLGYALSCHPTCFDEIEESRAPWSVNAMADQALPVLWRIRPISKLPRSGFE